LGGSRDVIALDSAQETSTMNKKKKLQINILQVQKEPTVTFALGGSRDVIALDSAQETSTMNKKKKLQAVEEVEYPIGVSVISQLSDN
jgi:hypothetical protein